MHLDNLPPLSGFGSDSGESNKVFDTGRFVRPGTVLLIAPEVIRERLAAVLREHVLYHAPTWAEGQVSLKDTDPDLVILHHPISDTEILACCRSLKQTGPGMGPLVIVMTGSFDSAFHEQLFEAGANDLVVLPAPVTVLTSRVRAGLKYRNAVLQLRETQDALERRVRQRTEELEQRNEDLRREITRRQQADEAFRKSTHVIRSLIQASPLAIFAVDTNNRIQICWNKAAERFFGWKEIEILDKPIPMLPPGESRKFLEALRAPTGEPGAPGVLAGNEVRFKNRQGQILLATVYSAPVLFNSGQASAYLCMAADVTEHRRLEEQLRQAQKMEAIGRLAGGIAHDFNNLITVINGYGNLLLSNPDAPAPQRKALESVVSAGERAARLTRQLLSFSRRQVVQPRRLDLNSVVADLNTILRRIVGEDIEMNVRLQPDLGAVNADLAQLEQVVMNLVVNSRDAMPKGGRLEIETSCVMFGTEDARLHPPLEPGSYVRLTVRDSGMGMDESVLSRLFEPFFTTKQPGVGTGLGLCTIYGIVKQSGGIIEVQSKLGEGSTFSVYLPRTDMIVPVMEGEAVAAPSKGHETILLVEDEDAVRELAQEILERNGYHVLAAPNGMSALKTLREAGSRGTSIKLLLTDVVMPGMNGRELAEQVQHLIPGVRTLFMSGYSARGASGQNILPPEAPCLEKPFSLNVLSCRVRELLDAPAAPVAAN